MSYEQKDDGGPRISDADAKYAFTHASAVIVGMIGGFSAVSETLFSAPVIDQVAATLGVGGDLAALSLLGAAFAAATAGALVGHKGAEYFRAGPPSLNNS